MIEASHLPEHLIARYRAWKAATHDPNLDFYRKLVAYGQHPKEMIISCCDSRVHVTSIFGADSGEMFIHRNIAGLVPPFAPDGDHHGTSAAVEYAVRILRIEHLLVLGHSNCGGVQGCYEMCSGGAPQLLEPTSFIGRWMDVLRVGYDRLPKNENEVTRRALLEKEAVIVSLENLMTFPFVQDAVSEGNLALHGLWNDIAEGTMEYYDSKKKAFVDL